MAWPLVKQGFLLEFRSGIYWQWKGKVLGKTSQILIKCCWYAGRVLGFIPERLQAEQKVCCQSCGLEYDFILLCLVGRNYFFMLMVGHGYKLFLNIGLSLLYYISQDLSISWGLFNFLNRSFYGIFFMIFWTSIVSVVISPFSLIILLILVLTLVHLVYLICQIFYLFKEASFHFNVYFIAYIEEEWKNVRARGNGGASLQLSWPSKRKLFSSG